MMPQTKKIPLSETQAGLWALGAMNPEGFQAYNEAMTFRLRGSYHHASMKRAFRTAVNLHEALQAKVSEEGESQIILEEVEAELSLVDLSALEFPEDGAAKMLAQRAAEPFGSSELSMVRGVVVRLAPEEHLLTLIFHHLMGNGPSYSIFVQHLCDLYEDLPVSRPAMQLSDFVRLQPSLGSQEDACFWEEQFPDAPSPLELPLDFARPSVRSFKGERRTLILHSEICARLRVTAASQGCSIFMALLSGFNLLLHRLSGQSDLVVGVPFESEIRSLQDGEELFANTTNVVPLRSHIDDNPRFVDYLKRMKALVLSASEHQEYFFGQLLKRMGSAQDPARAPLFSALFNYENGEFSRKIGDLQIDLLTDTFPYRGPLGKTMFELCFNVAERYGTLEVQCDFCSDLFTSETIERWLGCYLTLLDGIAENPSGAVLDLPLLDASEWYRIIVDWNATERLYPTDLGLHQFFEKQVQATPNAIALIFEGESLTYAELNCRANQLAHHLISRGTVSNSIVGLLAERSFEMVVGILAILKAGAAYLPLDPAYPKERLAFLIEDAQPAAVLAQRRHRTKLPSKCVAFPLEDRFLSCPVTNPNRLVKPEDTAYVIYTSGSTGNPKGVLNSHRGVANWLSWMMELFPLTANDTMVQKTPFTFDVSVREFFLPLATGARVVLARPGLHADTHYLVELIAHHQVSAIHFVPPMLGAFLGDPDAQRCTATLRWVLCSGDVLPYNVQEEFFAIFPQVGLHNLWGATETAPETSHWRCEPRSGRSSVPVGAAGANTQIYILDSRMKPVPVGVTGEVFVGGVQVASGYLRRPELTAEKFVLDPFRGGLLYRTGDLARFLPGGIIDFLGRLDDQIKLRGYRIELGEIEAVIERHPAVRECVALIKGQDEMNKRLIAYVVSSATNVEELREHAAQSLPDYMIPSAFLFLDDLPVTSNGKLDRKALPEPLFERRPYLAPRNEVERVLAAIWEQALDIPKISVTDNFFDLGGNSLIALRMFHRIRKELKIALPLAILLKAPTIEGVARKMKESASEKDWEPMVAIQPLGKRTPFFGIHGANGNVLFYRKVAEQLGLEQPFYALQAPGLDGRPIARTTVEEMGAYYLSEIRKIQPHGPYYIGGYSFGGLAAYDMARTLQSEGEEVALLVLFDTHNPAKPSRLVSPRKKLIERILDPDGMDLNRFFHFLAHNTRGSLQTRILKYNEAIQARLTRGKSDHDRLSRLAEIHVQTVYARAFFAYQPKPYKGKMTLFRAVKQPAGYEFLAELGWAGLVAGGIEIREVPGMHTKIFSDKNSPALAEILRGCIEAATSR